MADTAKLTIRVTSGRTASTVRFSTTGRYRSLQTGGISEQLLGQPLYTTADALHFWAAVLAAVQAEITSLGG